MFFTRVHIVFFLLLALNHLPAGAQQEKIDSLLKVLPSANDTNRVKILDQVSHAYLNRNNRKALDYANQALELANRTGNKVLVAYENITVGNIYTSLGDYHTSLRYVLRALELFETEKHYRGAAKAANVLGNIYLGQQNYSRSREYYELVIKYATLLRNDYTTSLGYLGVSNALSKMGELDKALRYIEKSEKGFRRAKRKMEYLAAIINKSSVYMELKRYRDAYRTLTGCLQEVEQTQDKYYISTVYTGIAHALREMKQYPQALDYYYRAIAVIQALRADDNLKDVYLQVSQLYESQHRPDSALKYLNGYVRLKDSLYRVENLKQVSEMEARFENDKKNAELRVQQEKLEASNRVIELQRENEKSSARLRNLLFVVLALVIVFLLFMYRSNLQKKKAYSEVSAQKQIIEQKNKEILDSIEYARRIQRTLLASDSLLKKHLHDHFILYQPKDIVSGDFYWATETTGDNGQTRFMICTADCTGHGVPGAFMSLLCISFLNEITRDRKAVRPNEVFTRLKHEIVVSLNPEEAVHTRDGMDAVLCSFDFSNLTLQMACANNPVLIIRGDEIIEIRPDKNPIGKNELTGYDYTLHNFDLQRGDQVYTFTDGYADQFGGASGKKFKFRQLKELLFRNRHLAMKEQRAALENTIRGWKGQLEQLDDILVIGIRV